MVGVVSTNKNFASGCFHIPNAVGGDSLNDSQRGILSLVLGFIFNAPMLLRFGFPGSRTWLHTADSVCWQH